MECSIEHTHLRNSRKNRAYGPDTKNISRIVKWCEHRALLKLSDDSICYELASDELLCTMNDTVADSLDIFKGRKDTMLLVKKSIDYCLDSDCMIGDRHFLYNLLLACSLMFKATDFHSDSFYQTLCQQIVDFLILHVEKLILE